MGTWQTEFQLKDSRYTIKEISYKTDAGARAHYCQKNRDITIEAEPLLIRRILVILRCLLRNWLILPVNNNIIPGFPPNYNVVST